MPPLPGLRSVPFEHAAISQRRIEEAGEAAGEGDDSHLFAAACAKEVWPSGSSFRISMAQPVPAGATLARGVEGERR